jgi:microcystin degradation protein MlrC
MKLVLAMMMHETNTFSPVPTRLDRFLPTDSGGISDADRYRGTNTGLGAYIGLAEERGLEYVIPLAASAPPSGPVAADTYRHMVEAIEEAVAAGCDAVLLDLHGAMVAETTEDGEGDLLESLRRIAPDVPIGVTLDMHTNLTDKMVANCTAMAGYKTYPHVDIARIGRRVGEIILDTLEGKLSPVMAWGNLPVLAATLRMGSDDEPMKSLQAMTEKAESEGCLAATLFGGFPLADIHDAGVSAVVVTNADGVRAASVKDALLAAAWDRRKDLLYRAEPLEESVARAKALEDGPIVLLDHADNCASGGTQDVMTVVAEVMRQGLRDVAVGAICDPQAVEEMAAAGVGAQVTVELGGKLDMPSIGLKGHPLEVKGTVRALTDGRFVVSGPMGTGLRVEMGTTAVLDTGEIQLVVISRHQEPYDLGLFRSVGIEPTEKRYLLLKSRIHYRAAFKPIARHIVECQGEGVTTSDMGRFRFEKVRRPILPLDEV